VRSAWQEPDIPYHVKRTVRHRDGLACVYCGSATPPLHIDHVWPRWWGGPGVTANLQTLCADCNRWKWRNPVVLVFRGERMYARKLNPRPGMFIFARLLGTTGDEPTCVALARDHWNRSPRERARETEVGRQPPR
jgi:hypothetical protein